MKLSIGYARHAAVIWFSGMAFCLTADACPVNKLLAPGTANPQAPGITDASILAPHQPGQIAALLGLAKLSEVNMGPSGNNDDKTCYLQTPGEREPRRFVVVAGKTYYADGRALWSTNNRSNTMNYVMDINGNFYIFDELSVRQIRHGSILDGGPVAGAGNMRIQNGAITCIDSDSGHYPSRPIFSQVLKVLAAFGAQPSQTICPQK